MVVGCNHVANLHSTLVPDICGKAGVLKGLQKSHLFIAMGKGLPIAGKPGTFADIAGFLIFAARHTAVGVNLNDKLTHFHVSHLLKFPLGIQGLFKIGVASITCTCGIVVNVVDIFHQVSAIGLTVQHPGIQKLFNKIQAGVIVVQMDFCGNAHSVFNNHGDYLLSFIIYKYN
nr:MAG TPA: hypothetical protein [Bacteriophage sp.]